MSGSRGARGRGPSTWTAGYRGPDRRSRSQAILGRVPGRSVGLTCLAVCIAVAVPALAVGLQRPAFAWLDIYLWLVAGLLAIATGAASLVSWRIGGRSCHGRNGAGFVTLGALMLIYCGLSSWHLADGSAVNPCDSLVIATVTGGLLWRGVTDSEVHAGLRPVLTAGMALGLGAGVMTVLGILATERVLPRWATGSAVHVVSFALAAAIWLALTTAVLRSVPDGASPPRWSACISGLMGMAVLVEVPIAPGWGQRLLSVTFVLLAMSLAFAGAVTRLRSVTVHDSQRQRRLQAALVATHRRAVREQTLTRAWRHDLRNAALGLQAVEAVLRTVGIESPASMEELTRAVSAELSRLQALVELPRSSSPTDVDLATVLGPLLAAERCQGARIDADLGDIRVRADKGSLCRVVQNLLVNARRHAGGRVDLRAMPRDGKVEIWIRDHGPGIPADERRSLFRRPGNVAGPASHSGNRLGLSIARNLMEEMGGRIRLIVDGEDGACFVLTLPAAESTSRSVDETLDVAESDVS